VLGRITAVITQRVFGDYNNIDVVRNVKKDNLYDVCTGCTM